MLENFFFNARAEQASKECSTRNCAVAIGTGMSIQWCWGHLMYAPGNEPALLEVSFAACHCICLACSCLSIGKDGCIAAIQDSAHQIFSAGLECTIAQVRLQEELSQLQIAFSRYETCHAYLEHLILACVLQNIIKGELQSAARSSFERGTALLSQLCHPDSGSLAGVHQR